MPADRRPGESAPIAFFLPDLPEGGVERVTLLLAEALLRRGARVQLVVADARGGMRSRVPDGVDVVDLRSGRVMRAVPGLVRYLRRERPAALVSAKEHANVAALVAAEAAGMARRVLPTVHVPPSVGVEDNVGWTGTALPHVAPIVYRRAARLVAVSRGVADDLSRTYRIPASRITVIPNPVIRPDLREWAGRPVDHPWLAAGERPVVLGIGRLSAEKDFATLVRAFALLRPRRPSRLIVLGDGEERAGLERLAGELGVGDEVDLPGFVDNPYAYLARAAVFALSSRREGLPTVLIEALACGTRVVSTDCPAGPAEILDGGRLGALVPVGDAAALAAALERALAGELAVAGPEDLTEYQVDTAAGRYAAVLGLPA